MIVSVMFCLVSDLRRHFDTTFMTIIFCFEFGVPHLYSFGNKMMFFKFISFKTHTRTLF